MRPASPRRVGVACLALAIALGPSAASHAQAPAEAPAPSGEAQAPAPSGPAIEAKAAILADAKTGKVLYARSARVQVPIASLTKVATALVARDRYALDEVVSVPADVRQVGGGKLGLEPGMQFTVHQLLGALLVMSGNDVAVALAAHDPLGVPSFVEAMNAKAKSLGATQSTFTNPHGLDEDGHLSTAFDVALLARRLLKDKVLAEIVATKRYALPWPDGTTRNLTNHNRLVLRNDSVIGVKTGFTSRAGRSLVAAAKTPAGTAISVVLNSQRHYEDTEALFAHFATKPVALPDLELATPRPVRLAAADSSAISVGSGPARVRWVVFPMALLALAMLLTLRRPDRPAPIREAAALHPFLEPYVAEDSRP